MGACQYKYNGATLKRRRKIDKQVSFIFLILFRDALPVIACESSERRVPIDAWPVSPAKYTKIGAPQYNLTLEIR